MANPISRRRFIAGTAGVVVASRLGATRSEAATRIRAGERRALGAAMDVIIPAEGRMPAASAVNGVAYVEEVAGRDADLRKLLLEALGDLGARFASSAEAQKIAALTRLERAAPAAFAALRDVVYEAYYTNPRIWTLLGYRFRSGPRRTGTLEAFDERQLDRVRSMARLYREADR